MLAAFLHHPLLTKRWLSFVQSLSTPDVRHVSKII
jgi:hypothetical protein